MTKIAERLSDHFDVKVISVQPTYASRGLCAPSHEVHNGVEIWRLKSTTLNKDVLTQRLINIFTVTLSIFIAALKSIRREDLVFVVTNPPTLPYAVMVASRLHGARTILRIDDVYPEVLSAGGLIGQGGLINRLVRMTTSFLYEYADKVIVLGRDMRELTVRRITKNPQKVETITNWADVDEVRPTDRNSNKLLDDLKLNDKFVVLAAGNIGRVQGIECLSRAAESLDKIDRDIHFLFIGSGAKKDWLRKQIERKGLKNITVLPNRPRADQVHFLNACDLAVSSLIPGMLGVSVPSRVYNILAAGKPILAVVDANSEVGLTVREEGVGWVAPPDSPEKIVEAILEAKSDIPLLKKMGEKARYVAENRFSSDKVLDAYVSFFKSVQEKSFR